LTRLPSLGIMQSNGEEGKKYEKAVGKENPRLVEADAAPFRKYVPEPPG